MGKTVFISCGQYTGVIVGVALEVPWKDSGQANSLRPPEAKRLWRFGT